MFEIGCVWSHQSGGSVPLGSSLITASQKDLVFVTLMG